MRKYNKDINVHALADAVAAALGPEWTATPGHQNDGSDASLSGPDLESLHLSVNTWHKSGEGKLIITGYEPEEVRGHTPYGHSWGEITVSHARGSEVIAAEITRRLLTGGFYETLAAARQAKRDSDAAAQAEAVTRGELLAALDGHGKEQPNPGAGPDAVRSDWIDIGSLLRGGVHGEARILSSDVRFTLNVPREYAVAMAKAVAQLAGQVSSDRAAAASRVG